MNTSILDKTTDKIIGKMKPEELAKYANDQSNLFAHAVAEGRMGYEAQKQETELFYNKHVRIMPTYEYIRYLKAYHNEYQKTAMQELGKQELRIFDLRIALLESTIITFTLVYEHGSLIDVDDVNAAAREQNIIAAVKTLFTTIEEIKKEKEEFLSDPNWNKFGGVPTIPARESHLSPEVVRMYKP